MPRELSNIERTTLADICEIIRETIDTEIMYLFGSRAYGTPNEDSDYDILVVSSDDSPRPADAIKQIRRALLEVQTTPLDIIVCRASQFAQRQVEPSLERKIARDGILLYDKDSDAKSAPV